MAEFHLVGGVKKLNNTNYNTWSTCMSSYLQGQDLWEVVQGADTVQPRNDVNGAINKWKIKTGKAMFVLKTTIEEELLDHIRDLATPKEAWDVLAALFSKKNDAKLQLLENELLSIAQKNLTVSQYFHKVKTLCREIGELDPQARIGEARMKRILIFELKPEYRTFVAAIQGWPTQPSLVEFENLLAAQEALVTQMAEVKTEDSVKKEDTAMYADRGKGKFRKGPGQRRFNDRNKKNEKGRDREGTKEVSDKKDRYQGKKFPYKCYGCGKKGHMARNCPEKKDEEGNAAATSEEEPWDAEAHYARDEPVYALTATTEKQGTYVDDWIFDSGCSNHMTGNKRKLKNPKKYDGSRVVVIADNSRHNIAHIGEVQIEDNESRFSLENVYHVPGMKKNLLSVPQITEAGRYVLFGPNDVQVFDEFEKKSKPVLCGKKNESVYVLSAGTAYVDKTKSNQGFDIWHQRLGHVGYDRLELIVKRNLVAGIPDVEVKKNMVCAGCQYGKAHQLPYESSNYHATKPLELVHSDVFGPVKQKSIKGMRYMITFSDDYSRYVWVYFMQEKSEAFSKFKEFKAEAERETKMSVGCLRSDNGGEYTSKEFNEYLKECRIKRQLTCSHTPQQNGVSERLNRTLTELTGSMIHDKNLPGRFWAESMLTAAYIHNRIPQQGLKYKSPFEKMFNKKPNVSYFRVFGCVCYVFIQDHLRHKLERKAIRCIFIGYDSEKKGWRCCDPKTNKCYVSRDVIFDEASTWWSDNYEQLPDTQVLKDELDSYIMLNISEPETTAEEEVEPVIEGPSSRQGPWQTGMNNQGQGGGIRIEGGGTSSHETRRSTRPHKPNPRYANLAVLEDVETEPTTFEEAEKKEEWMRAMKEEIDALRQNQTWELVSRVKDMDTVSCKWVYKIKRKVDGSVDRYKARLVARGFSQQYGLDYEETFSPVAKLTSVRVLLAIAASKGWRLWQMDVSNAFLYGDLDHVIYMDQPRGFESAKYPNHVCKLKKALYGLKQSPRAWFGKIGEFLEINGFKSATSDASLFIRVENNKLAVVLVYVDDLIITGDLEDEIEQLKKNLCIRFNMKDLGILKHFLGLELCYRSDGMILHQQKYSIELLSKFGLNSCKPAITPMDCNLQLSAEEGKDLEDATMYRKIVGSLIYLTITRPDISYAVGVLSRFMQRPKKPHLDAARRVLRYVKHTPSYGVLFKRESKVKLSGFCDADYAKDPSTRRSTTGFVFMIGSGAVSWCSKRQPTVSLSTTEAEYRAAAMAAQECTWLIRLLNELGQEVDYKVDLYGDNISSIRLAENPTFHARTKHVEVHYHFIREKVLLGEINFEYVNTHDQTADMFTKALTKEKMIKFCESLGLVEANIEREY
ncbi:putative RNA-directed DNA polymerase [Helianthus debilis subsp. tardiflorus]